MFLNSAFRAIIYLIYLNCQIHSWKIHLCLNSSTVETHDGDCKSGIWFTEPKVIHKICFEHGVWAIYREFCEDNPVIWTVHPGKRGCMTHDQLGNRIAGIISIGRSEEAGAIISTSNRRLFFSNHKLKHGMKIDFIEKSHAHVEVLTWGSPSISYALQQFHDETGSLTQKCLIKGKQSFFAYYKIQLEKNHNVSISLAKDACKKRPSDDEGVNTFRNKILPSEIDFDIIQSSSEDLDEPMNCDRFKQIDDQFEWDEDEDRNELEKDSIAGDGKILSKESVKNIERRVDQETQKITLRLLSNHFRKEEIHPSDHFNQWEFLDVAKNILLKVCPRKMVPAFFIKQIYLLFHAILQESFKSFPEVVHKDEDSKQRILNALHTCLKNASEFQFKDGATCTKDAPLLKIALENGTKTYLFKDMPSFIKIDTVNYDLIMESIWKFMNFAFYYCADTFQKIASDQSFLEEHWQNLFSPLVIRRWKYPGRTYQVMQQLFSSINLERSVKNLDFCVSAAHLHSSYKGWLKRPLSHWDKVKKLDIVKGIQLIWDGQAHCLDDYMYPVFKLGYPIEKCGIKSPILPKHVLGASNIRL